MPCENFRFYSDLTAERRPADVSLPGVSLTEQKGKEVTYSRLTVDSDQGAIALQKPKGRYHSLFFPAPTLWTKETVRELKTAVTEELPLLSFPSPETVLAVGLGNRTLTADLFGPLVCDGLCATGHLKSHKKDLFQSLGCKSLFVFCPGVMGQTGFETADSVKNAVRLAKPDLVLLFDSLATLSPKHLLTSLQMTDTGITPGGGVGNQRLTLTPDFLETPTVALGLPTVISACVLAEKEDESLKNLYVAPKNTDTELPLLARLLDETLNGLYGLSLSPFEHL